jgi:hypothetical protein
MKLGDYILAHRATDHSLEGYEDLLTSFKKLMGAERSHVVELALYQGQPDHAVGDSSLTRSNKRAHLFGLNIHTVVHFTLVP